MPRVLEVTDIHKSYYVQPPVHALKGVTFSVNAGERVAIVGSSGSGKSTLLNVVGLLDKPSSGRVFLEGTDITHTSGAALDRLRSEVLGFVFQEHHVLGARTVQENLELRLGVSSFDRREWQSLIDSTLHSVDLLHKKHSLGRLLSGGEKQRLAVARAVISQPKMLLADEPTGNLDEANAHRVLDIFDRQAARGVAVIVITHDDRLTRWADRVLMLKNGVMHYGVTLENVSGAAAPATVPVLEQASSTVTSIAEGTA